MSGFKDVKTMGHGDIVAEMLNPVYRSLDDNPPGSIYEKVKRNEDRFEELQNELNKREKEREEIYKKIISKLNI
jgi:hypothetical protein